MIYQIQMFVKFSLSFFEKIKRKKAKIKPQEQLTFQNYLVYKLILALIKINFS